MSVMISNTRSEVNRKPREIRPHSSTADPVREPRIQTRATCPLGGKPTLPGGTGMPSRFAARCGVMKTGTWALAVASCVLSFGGTACAGSSSNARDGSPSTGAPVCAHVTLGDARRILGPRASADRRVRPAEGCYYSLRGPRTATSDGSVVQVTKILAVRLGPRADPPAVPKGRHVKIPGVASPGTWSATPNLGLPVDGGTLAVNTTRGVIQVTVIGTGNELAFAMQVARAVEHTSK